MNSLGAPYQIRKIIKLIATKINLFSLTSVLVLTIPPVWKRAVAEFIDFFILFVLKMGTTYLAINHFRLLWVFLWLGLSVITQAH